MIYNPEIHHRRSIRLKGYDYSQNGVYFVTICTHNREQLFGHITNGTMVLNEYGKIVEKCWFDLPNHYNNVKLDEFVIMPNHFHGIIWIVDTFVGAIHESPLHESSQHESPQHESPLQWRNPPQHESPLHESSLHESPQHESPQHESPLQWRNPPQHESPLQWRNPPQHESPLQWRNPPQHESPLQWRNPPQHESPLQWRNPPQHESPLQSPIQSTLHESIQRQNDIKQRRNMLLSKIIGRLKMNSAKQINILRNTPGIPVWQRNYYEHIIRDDESFWKITEYIKNNPADWEKDDYHAQ